MSTATGRPNQCEPKANRAKRGLSLLLVDDTPANLKILQRLLLGRGHRVVVASDGCEAFSKYQHGRFDVVLMDVEMPAMNGCEATLAIRQHEQACGAHTPIIALTTHSAEGDRQRCLDAGMDAFLCKPIHPARLFEIVENLADSHASDSMLPKAGRPHDDRQVMDYDGAMKRLGGDAELFRDFISVFDEDSPVLVSSLREALAARDGVALQRAAHSLRGLTANFGASLTMAPAAELEEIGKTGHWDDAEQLLTKLEQALAQLNSALDHYRK